MPAPKVLVVGDVMTDILVRPEGPLALGADRRATIRALPGGSGANQACWLAGEGVAVTFVARVGAADHGHQSGLLAAAGVTPALASDPDRPTGTLVTLLSPDGERSFLTDRGANENLGLADLPDTLLDDVDHLHVSGYALFAEGPRAAVLEFLRVASARKIPFSIDPASWSFLEEAGSEKFLAWTQGASICFCNEDEARVLTGGGDPKVQVAHLTENYLVVVLKRGATGAVAADAEGGSWSAPSLPAEVVDTSGAGDAFLGGFLAARLRGEPIDAALRRGIILGARAVTKLGARPAPATIS